LTTSIHLVLKLINRTVFYFLHMSSCHGQGLLYFFYLINFDLATHFTSLPQFHLEDFCSDVQVEKLNQVIPMDAKKKF
jgi:hypothetical protein